MLLHFWSSKLRTTTRNCSRAGNMLPRIELVPLLLAPCILLVTCGEVRHEVYGGGGGGGCKSRCCDEAHVRMEAGWVCGKVREAEDGSKYASFRGIPYAKPPLGERRFKELEPVDPWGDHVTFEAFEDSAACPQNDFIYGRLQSQHKGQSEDCMYLNLHAPCDAVPKHSSVWQNTVHRGLPILVFIHEGAFQCGSGLTDFCGAEYLLTRRNIVITFNYRINVFGFLSLGCKEIPGNQGLRDMVTLLRWVQRNARAFGGDPDNVTLMGHSGGGTSAHILSLSKAARGLFKRLIIMSSNALPAYYTTSPDYAKNIANMFLQELGINETDPRIIHQKLIRMPLVKLMAANSVVQFKAAFVSFCPVEEPCEYPGQTRILDENPLTLIAMGRAREYPTLMGFTSNEMGFSRLLMQQKGIVDYLKQDPTMVVSLRLLYSLPEAEILRIAEAIDCRYFHGNPTPDSIMQYYTDMYFKHTVLKAAEWRASAGGAPLYLYKFAFESDNNVAKRAFWTDYSGAAHFDDYACVFRANSILGNEVFHPPDCDDDKIKIYMVDIVTNFMHCSNPTCDVDDSVWPPVSKHRILYNLISTPFNVQMMHPTPEEIDVVQFFDSLDPQVRNLTSLLANQQNIDTTLYCDYSHCCNSK